MENAVRLLRQSKRGGSAGGDVLRVRDLSKSYEDGTDLIHACQDIGFDLGPGEFGVVRGPSGSGKSTLLLACAGLVPVDAGRVAVCGTDLTSMSEVGRARARLEHVGVVFQEFLLIEEYTVLSNVQLPLEGRGWSLTDARVEALGWLDRVGLSGMGHRYPAELSGGQRQRVGIARALVGGRQLVIADEPTGSLDSATSREVFVLLHEVSRQDVGVLVASHDAQIEDLADRVFDMCDGRLVASS